MLNKIKLNKSKLVKYKMEQNNFNKQIVLPENMEAYLIQKRKYFIVKRVFDIMLSILALIILWPIFLATIIAIKLDSKGKIFFLQQRTGKNGKVFTIYKFRSMHEGEESKKADLSDLNEMDGPVFKISKDPRITKVGRFIRKYSIDELPQLLNILRGDMSIVGPRPLVISETANFNEYENIRHLIKPGLSCYWQIGGRNTLSFEEWMYLDLKYITEMCLKIDLIIILKTFKVVIMKEGAY